MKFKIPKGTPLFDTLKEVAKKMKEVNAEAQKIVDEIPDTEGFSPSNHGIAGGIKGIAFKEYSKKKEGWNKMESGVSKWFMPKAANKELWAKIRALPVLSKDEVNKPLNFSFGMFGNMEIWHTPKIMFKKSAILVQYPDMWKGTPPADAVEILASEWNKI